MECRLPLAAPVAAPDCGRPDRRLAVPTVLGRWGLLAAGSLPVPQAWIIFLGHPGRAQRCSCCLELRRVITAIVGLSLLGISQIFTPLMPVQVALAVLYTAVLYLGSGAMSLAGRRKTGSIYRRAGERRSTLKTRPRRGGRSDMRRLRRLWKPRLLVWAALLPLMWLALRDIPLQECVEHSHPASPVAAAVPGGPEHRHFPAADQPLVADPALPGTPAATFVDGRVPDRGFRDHLLHPRPPDGG